MLLLLVKYLQHKLNQIVLYKRLLYITAPSIPPAIGPNTGTIAYPQLEPPLPAIGNIA